MSTFGALSHIVDGAKKVSVKECPQLRGMPIIWKFLCKFLTSWALHQEEDQTLYFSSITLNSGMDCMSDSCSWG